MLLYCSLVISWGKPSTGLLLSNATLYFTFGERYVWPAITAPVGTPSILIALVYSFTLKYLASYFAYCTSEIRGFLYQFPKELPSLPGT